MPGFIGLGYILAVQPIGRTGYSIKLDGEWQQTQSWAWSLVYWTRTIKGLSIQI